jgi:hypothetical protein
MGELYAEQAESAPAEGRGAAAAGHPGSRKAAAYEAHGALRCAFGAPATPIATRAWRRGLTMPQAVNGGRR